jgi:hypothetical protein
MEELAKLPATLFSPAKMVFIAFITVLILRPDRFSSSCAIWGFVLASAAFLAIEIVHNDWLRIRLNNNGEQNRPEWKKDRSVAVFDGATGKKKTENEQVVTNDLLIIQSGSGVIVARVIPPFATPTQEGRVG